jgi:hypothetical protein
MKLMTPEHSSRQFEGLAYPETLVIMASFLGKVEIDD